MNNTRKLLITAGILVLVAAVIGVGYASFSAQTSNASNTVAAGTLVLSNTKTTQTSCLSTGAGSDTGTNTNSNCGALLTLDTRKPGDTGEATTTLKNEGSLPGTLATFTTACTNSNSTTGTFHGTGDMCGLLQLTIQRYSDNTFKTATSCVYGGGDATTCAFTSTKTLATFASAYSAPDKSLSVGPLGPGESAFLKVSVSFPKSAGNEFQGRLATFDFQWLLSQA